MTSMSIDIWLDFSSLASYLGLNGIRQAVSEWSHKGETRLALHPFFGDTNLMDLPESVDPSERGLSISEVSNIDDHAHAAQSLVASLAQTESGADTLQLKVAEALMRSRFEMGLDITDPDVLVGIGQDFGIPAKQVLEAIQSPAIAALVDEGYSLGLHLGITSTPVYLFDEALLAQGPLGQQEFTDVLQAAWQQQQAGE